MMGRAEALALLCWGLMWLAFIQTKAKTRRFNAICLLLFGLAAAAFATGSRSLTDADALATLAGLLLLWIGLLMLRAMLQRSVSLDLLMCRSGGDSGLTPKDHFGRRLDEAVRYHLVSGDADGYTLSPVGAVLSFAIGSVYLSLGIRK